MVARFRATGGERKEREGKRREGKGRDGHTRWVIVAGEGSDETVNWLGRRRETSRVATIERCKGRDAG